jgi:hypothetical protein
MRGDALFGKMVVEDVTPWGIRVAPTKDGIREMWGIERFRERHCLRR